MRTSPSGAALSRGVRRLVVVALATVAIGAGLTGSASAASDRAVFHRWNSDSELKRGSLSNATVLRGSVAMKGGTSASWTSPWQSTGFAARTLVPTWNVKTSAGSWAVIEARVKSGSTVGSWDKVATWALTTDTVKRASGTSQTDDLARLSTDTVIANSGKTFTSYQVRVTLRRTSTKVAAPVLGTVNAVAASYSTRSPSTSATSMTRTVDLDVPRYSQMAHRTHRTSFDGGGAAWCSPTSASMALRYVKIGPTWASYKWTKEAEGFVDHGAVFSYDYAYRGTGNWAFNTAYASRYNADAFVTRLYSLREAEQFIKAGIPVVISVAFGRGELSGAPLSSTPGHLMVIRGFNKTGSVIVNDPAAPSASTVRRTYQRGQLERAWQRGSGGIVYVMKRHTKALPADTARW